jgi:general secretion pathway protein D
MSHHPVTPRLQPTLSFGLRPSFVLAVASGLLLAGGMAGNNAAGPPAVVGSMEAEITKRLAATQEAAALVAEGDRLRDDKDHAAAIDKYRKAVDLLPLAPMVEKQRAEALQRYADTAVVQARLLGNEGRFEDANNLLGAVLDPLMLPDHPGALRLKEQLKDPDRFNPSMSPDFHAKITKVQKLLDLANGFVEIGDFNTALEAYKQILLVDRHNTAAQRGMEKCEKLIADYHLAARDHTRAKAFTQVDKQWETAVPDTLLTPRLPGASQGSKVPAMASKLRGIIFPRVSFESADLAEVVQFLVAKCREYDQFEADPNKKGVNIILKLNGAEQAKLPKITLNLSELPLYQVLDYVADQTGTKWKLADGLVSFSSIVSAGNKLNTRIFSVPPGFLSGAPAGDPASVTNDPFASPTPGSSASTGIVIQKVGAQDFLEKSGIPFPKGASASFDRGNSRLVVTNTDENLDAVEVFVSQIVSKATKSALIRVTKLEINQSDLEEMGFDVLLGQFNIGKRLFGGGGTYGTKGTPTAPGQDYPFLDPSVGSGRSVPTGQLPLTGGLRGSSDINSIPTLQSLLQSDRYAAPPSKLSPGIFGLVGAFTDPQFQFVMRALNQKKGTDLMTSTEILVKSGAIAKARSIRELSFPTDFDPAQIPQSVNNDQGVFIDPTTGQAGAQGGQGEAPITPASPTSFKMEEIGNVLDVEATIAEDNTSVDLRLAPVFTEFLGFINYGNPINRFDRNGNPYVVSRNQIVQPIFERIRTSNPTTVTVYDGNTIAFGGLKQSSVNEINDKVPILGDIPLIGRLFKSHTKSSQRKAVILFVTVNIVDPAGRRIAPQRGGADQPLAGTTAE